MSFFTQNDNSSVNLLNFTQNTHNSSMIVNITAINSLMESFHDDFNGILFWMHDGKETKDTGVICYGMIP